MESEYKKVMKVFWRMTKRAGFGGVFGGPGFPKSEVSRLMKVAWRLVKRGEQAE